MNIAKILRNVNTVDINTKNISYINKVFSELYREESQNNTPLIGKYGLILDDVSRLATALDNCGSSVVVAKKGKKQKIVEAHYCGNHKLCPICSDKTSGERIKRIDTRLADEWENINYAYLTTFTIQDNEDIYEAIETLRDGFREWQRLGQKGRDGEYNKVLGGTKSLEVKLGKNSGKFHPHYHCILFTKEPIDYSCYNEDILAEYRREVKAGLIEDTKENFKKEMGLRGGYRYTFPDGKAASKFSLEWFKVTGSTNAQCKPIFTPQTKPETIFSMIQKSNEEEKNIKKALSSDENYKPQREYGVYKAVKYSLKYSIKPQDIQNFSPLQFFQVVDCLKKYRTIEYLGFLNDRKTKGCTAEMREAAAAAKAEEKEEKRKKLFEFLVGSEVERVTSEGNEEGEVTFETDTQLRYLYSVAPQFQFEYKSLMPVEVAKYRLRRRELFALYEVGLISGKEYIDGVEFNRDLMKSRIRVLKEKRDKKIDEYTNGVYSAALYREEIEASAVRVVENGKSIARHIEWSQQFKGEIPVF